MMKVIDNRFAAREEQWGMILQDLKYDRMWGIKKEENIEYYKEELLSNNPYTVSYTHLTLPTTSRV